MRQLYSFIMYLLTPYLFFRLWWKGRHLPAYRERMAERFCLDNNEHINVDIWVHAVSLGEVIAVTPLIDALISQKKQILLTTMTPTGAQRAQQQFKDKIVHRYVPYDLPWVLKRFFTKVKPKLGLIVETELWPNLIHYASQIKLPLYLINARLSERSYRGYAKLRFLFKTLLNQFSEVLAQGEEDANRFRRLGAENVTVLGNIKFDLQTKQVANNFFGNLKLRWGCNRIVILIASTHDDEEAQILSHLKELQAKIPNLLLLVAPRHPERFQKVFQLCVGKGFRTALRSKPGLISEENEIIVLDSLGELLGFYQLCDYAFVGGSFVPVGGHNVLEPIAMRVPVLSGPHVHNFKAICRDLKEAQAIEIVENAKELIEKIIALHQNETKKKQIVQNATLFLESNKGAINRYLEKIEPHLAE